MFAILFLIGIIFYVALSGYIYRYVAKKTNKKFIKFITIFILIFVAVGDNILGEAVFYYLCKTESGKKIYKTVENVEGFYVENYTNGIFPLMTFLFEGKYKFIEAKVDTPKEGLFADSAGYYRFNLSDLNDNNCHAFNEWKSEVMKRKVNFYEKFTSRSECIASNKIDTPQSSYSIIYYEEKNILPFLFISRTKTKIKNILTDEIIGEANEYYYSGGWILQLFFGGVGHTKSCPESKPTKNKKYFQTELIYDVLHPISK